MKETSENSKESSHSAHAKGMNEWLHSFVYFSFPLFLSVYVHETLADKFSCFNFGSKVNERSRLQEFLTTLPYTNRQEVHIRKTNLMLMKFYVTRVLNVKSSFKYELLLS